MAKERCIKGILCSLKNVKSDSTSCSKLYDFRSSMEHKNAKGDLSIECFVALKSHLCHNQEPIVDNKPSDDNFKCANESANENFLPIDSLKSSNDSLI